jgi:uncharacterized BrkB/YihY/UPF0761 family membrane protein
LLKLYASAAAHQTSQAQGRSRGALAEKEMGPPRVLAFAPSISPSFVRVGRSFIRNRGLVRAAALAYTTVLALVPMLAVVISLSAGLLKNESGKIDQWIRHGVNTVAPTLGLSASDEQQKELDRVTAYIKDSINNFRSGGLAGTAVVALIFVAISCWQCRDDPQRHVG